MIEKRSRMRKSARWSVSESRDWYTKQKWLVGCNYIPATAINQLEMWQKETFDRATIDKELGWAQAIGFNVVRCFCYDLLWDADAAGFMDRMRQFLAIADSHGMKTMFVLFDDCWNDNAVLGKQPDPKPGCTIPAGSKVPARQLCVIRRAGLACSDMLLKLYRHLLLTSACCYGTCSMNPEQLHE